MSTATADGATAVQLAGADERLRSGFVRWQCRLRQIAARTDAGRPGDGCVPSLTLPGDGEPLGHVITVLNRAPAEAMTEEFRHMVRRERDQAKRLESAVRLFSETYYGDADRFADTLTSTFSAGSPGAERILRAGACRLAFSQFSQTWSFDCAVRRFEPPHHFREATFWHNLLFNPHLRADCIVLGFEPEWHSAQVDPPP